MLCQSCGQNVATTHVKTIVNGELAEYALCSACAQKLGYTSLFHDWGSGLESLLGGFFGEPPRESQTVRCRGCGISFAEISESGEVGCPECYQTFRDRLMPTIRRIHGAAKHTGKAPGSHKTELQVVKTSQKDPIAEKEAAMQQAITEQNFELAAKLRDEIKQLKEQL